MMLLLVFSSKIIFSMFFLIKSNFAKIKICGFFANGLRYSKNLKIEIFYIKKYYDFAFGVFHKNYFFMGFLIYIKIRQNHNLRIFRKRIEIFKNFQNW